MKKWIVGLLLVAMLCGVFCACGAIEKDITRDEAIGTWEGEWEHFGNKISTLININSSGAYERIVYRNGNFDLHEFGTWVIEDGDVVLYDMEDRPGELRYNYIGGALENGGHKLHKD